MAVGTAPGAVALAHVSCETDFVARTDGFSSLLPRIARAAAAIDAQPGMRELPAQELGGAALEDGQSVRPASAPCPVAQPRDCRYGRAQSRRVQQRRIGEERAQPAVLSL